MKVQELRIGNYVNYNIYKIYKQGVIRTINNNSCNITTQGDSSPIDTIKFKSIEPIPLTEEWLLKLGFHRIENGYFGSMPYNRPCWVRFSFTILIWENGSFVYGWNGGNTMLTNVHQLQNLYFALTGEELIIK